jgi:hypothetical protein
MKGKTARLLPLLHTLVEERAGERRFPTHPPPFMSQPWRLSFLILILIQVQERRLG